MKMCLREMSQPLLTFDLYSDFIDAVSGDEKSEKTAKVKKAVKKLPPANRALLEHLITFLGKVALKSDQNKMTPHSLAIVMAPNLLRSKQASTNQMAESH